MDKDALFLSLCSITHFYLLTAVFSVLFGAIFHAPQKTITLTLSSVNIVRKKCEYIWMKDSMSYFMQIDISNIASLYNLII